MLPYLIHHDFTDFVLIGIVLIVAITIHEFGHALADELEGDPTAREAGRLSLNPARHLDPFGTLMIALVGFGWGKPVPINTAAMRSRRFGGAIVGLAGPATNLILAITSALALRSLKVIPIVGFASGPGITLTNRFLSGFLYINVILALLNLIPIPPLDGSRILSAVLPPDKQHFVYFMDRWGFLIILIAALFVLPTFLGSVASAADRELLRLVGFKFYYS
jgi:Zn-dependent protease